MSDEPNIVKDPSKKGFWTLGNIAGLFLLAIVPLLVSKISDYFTFQDKLLKRLEKLEEEQANNKAIWSAITDQNNRMNEIDIVHRAAMLAISREYGKSTVDRTIEKFFDREMGPRRPEGGHPADPPDPPIPVDPKDPKPPNPAVKPVETPLESVAPDKFRDLYEQKFPIQRKK